MVQPCEKSSGSAMPLVTAPDVQVLLLSLSALLAHSLFRYEKQLCASNACTSQALQII